MNRRAFLKLFVCTVAVATIPIPRFLTPEQKPVDDLFKKFSEYGNSSSFTGGTLTQEMLEEAALRSAQNMGHPDMIIMEEETCHAFAKYFGYQITYE